MRIVFINWVARLPVKSGRKGQWNKKRKRDTGRKLSGVAIKYGYTISLSNHTKSMTIAMILFIVSHGAPSTFVTFSLMFKYIGELFLEVYLRVINGE